MKSFISKFRNYILLHLIVFIWGFTGILGKLIDAPASLLVWYRMMIASIGLLAFLMATNANLRVDLKRLTRFFLVGIIIALHWITFFESIKISTVSVALTCMATSSFFTAILEPIFYKRKFIWYEFILGVLIVMGIYMIFEFESQYRLGIMYALTSAFLASLFNVLNGVFVRKTEGTVISMYELASGFIGISIFFILTDKISLDQLAISGSDVFYLLVLGLICTAFAFAVSVQIMKTIPPYTVAITINLEPIYAIVMALILFGEDERMTTGFYLGAVIILATILLNSYLKNKLSAKKMKGMESSE